MFEPHTINCRFLLVIIALFGIYCVSAIITLYSNYCFLCLLACYLSLFLSLLSCSLKTSVSCSLLFLCSTLHLSPCASNRLWAHCPCALLLLFWFENRVSFSNYSVLRVSLFPKASLLCMFHLISLAGVPDQGALWDLLYPSQVLRA